MTEYTVRTEYMPEHEADVIPWKAVLLDEDGAWLSSAWGATREEAVAKLQSTLRAQAAESQVEEFTADALGQPLEQPSGHMMGER